MAAANSPALENSRRTRTFPASATAKVPLRVEFSIIRLFTKQSPSDHQRTRKRRPLWNRMVNDPEIYRPTRWHKDRRPSNIRRTQSHPVPALRGADKNPYEKEEAVLLCIHEE